MSAAFGLRNFSLATISTIHSDNEVTIAAALMTKTEMEQTLQFALKNQEVKEKLKQNGYNPGEKFLYYIVPADWYLSDLPIESMPEWANDGHYKPVKQYRTNYKILFAKAVLPGNSNIKGLDIVKKASGMIPFLVVKLNNSTGEILSIENPPTFSTYTQWGDMPMPLF